MRDEEDKNHLTMSRMLRPVTDPLKTLVKTKLYCNDVNEKYVDQTNENKDKNDCIQNLSTSTKYEDIDDTQNSFVEDSTIVHDHEESSDDNSCFKSPFKIEKCLERSLDKEDIDDIYGEINVPFGIRSENNTLFMGNSEVKLTVLDNPKAKDKTHLINIKDKQYQLTPGLKELLLRKNPDLRLVLDQDRLVYRDMLCHTNVHKRHYSPNEQIKGDKSIKYREIIKPLFLELPNIVIDDNDAMLKQGSSLPILKKYKRDTDLVYWDNPNELIDRLKILVASRDAGNTNHDNEIISIIEVLKEAGIIKEIKTTNS